MSRPHLPTLWSGIVFIGLGVAFALEAVGVWVFDAADLRLLGPLALVAVGVGILLGARSRGGR